eukprot:5346775-Pleurochrysis_carterae.AAC.2
MVRRLREPRKCIQVSNVWPPAVHRIGIPLVWRYLWREKEQRVLVQFKFSMADKGNFMRSEYGPWVEEMATRNNPLTGVLETVKVLRFTFYSACYRSSPRNARIATHHNARIASLRNVRIALQRTLSGEAKPETSVTVLRTDSKGVEMMAQYPDVSSDPGVEDWLPQEKWSFQRVFHDIANRIYVKRQKASNYGEQWAALRAWHTAYSTADSIPVGQRLRVHGELDIGGTPPLSWSAM